MGICPYCGSAVADDTTVCESCGGELAPLDEPRDTEKAQIDPSETEPQHDLYPGEHDDSQLADRPDTPASRGSDDPATTESPGQDESDPDERDSGIGRRKALAGGGTVAGIALLGGGWVAFLRDGGDDLTYDTTADGGNSSREEEPSSGQGPSDEDTSGPTETIQPGTDFGSAPLIEPGRYGQFHVQDGGSHYFAVELPAETELVATVFFDHDEGDLDLKIYDSDQQSLDSGYSTDDNESVEALTQSETTYYIQVYGYSGASNRYDLDISYSAGN